MTKELTTELITHKLKIKGEGTKYITKKMAENIFNQLSNTQNNTITIANPETMTFITKYRSEIDLVKLNDESKDFEDMLFISGLSDEQKDEIRDIWELRRKEKKLRTNGILKNIIESFKEK